MLEAAEVNITALAGGRLCAWPSANSFVARHLIVLDEPTNHIDLETIRLIEEFLRHWTGTLVVVSHERAFLSQTTDRLVLVRNDGYIRDVPGGIDGWIAASEATPAPTRGDDTTPVGRRLRDAEKGMVRLERRMNHRHVDVVHQLQSQCFAGRSIDATTHRCCINSARSFPPTLESHPLGALRLCPRQDSNLRSRFRKPMLYPLSYEGGTSA